MNVLLVGSIGAAGLILLGLAGLMIHHMHQVTSQLQQLIDLTERVGNTAERAALRAETVLQYTQTPMPSPQPTQEAPHAPPAGE